jgi:tight adherence protein B
MDLFQLIVVGSAFVGAATLAGGIAMMFRKPYEEKLESRLSNLTANHGHGIAPAAKNSSILNQPLDSESNGIEDFVAQFLNVRTFIEQSGLTISPIQLIAMSVGLGVVSAVLWVLFAPFKILAPILFFMFFVAPSGWVFWKRRQRLKKFSSQLVEALELISRALRAGHSLPAGIQLIAKQMDEPISVEFMRCYEEQNLGIPLEESMEEMTRRVPNVDLRFFVTAVILQRQTGGDLAEILDKISRLIRERFQIFGQIAALTGEGRLSGIVLLALPPVLFLVMLKLNYAYVMLLFEDPLGQMMLGGAIVMQVLGALVIRKIINIRV